MAALAVALACGGQSIGDDPGDASAGFGGSNPGTGGGNPAGGSTGGTLVRQGGSRAVGAFRGSPGGNRGFGGWNGAACFVAGTPIHTPHGTTAIERLRVGDWVLAYDEARRRVVERRVTDVHVHSDRVAGRLHVGPAGVLELTAEHPIYLPDEGRYVAAAELRSEQRLLTLSGARSTASAIASAFELTSASEPVTVYNITVEGEENYFAAGVLVHNKSGAGNPDPCPPNPPILAVDAACISEPVCVDIVTPGSEYVTKNAPAPHVDGGVEPFVLDTPACSQQLSTSWVHLAFDVYSSAPAPTFELYSGNAACSGSQLGELWLFDDEPPAVDTWTTQCVRVERFRIKDHLTLVAATPGARVANLRAVSGCACARQLKEWTTCGIDPSGAGGGSSCW